MKTLYMLDTNTVSYIAKGRSKAARARMLGVDKDETVCLSAITEAEIIYGLARRPEATGLRERMEWFLSAVTVLPFDREAARAYGTLRAVQEAQGMSLENMDLLIASHAIAAGAVLVTSDQSLAKAEGLKQSENWATDLYV